MVRRSTSPNRHHFRAPICNSLAGDSQGTRPSSWSDVLASISRMAETRSVGLHMEGCFSQIKRARSAIPREGSRGWLEHHGQKGGETLGPTPADRGKNGCKHHIVVDQQGIPLGATISPAYTHDSKMMTATIDAIPPIRGRVVRPLSRPVKAHCDRGYDYQRCRKELRDRGIFPE
jgi:hypothetical protein